jgi:hypothetical protein
MLWFLPLKSRQSREIVVFYPIIQSVEEILSGFIRSRQRMSLDGKLRGKSWVGKGCVG